MTQENRNLILAMILSVAVLFAFDHFVAGPQRKVDAQRAQAAKVEQQVAQSKPVVPQLDRGQVLAASPRVDQVIHGLPPGPGAARRKGVAPETARAVAVALHHAAA